MEVLLVTAFACVVCQCIKVLMLGLQKKKVHFHDIFTTGGMPSTHSAIVSALALSVLLTEGIDSVAFAISAVLAFIVICDSAGLRSSVGKQASVLNKVIEEMKSRQAISEKVNDVPRLVGHTVLQVLVGILIGTIAASAWFVLLA